MYSIVMYTIMKQKISVEDRERIETRLRQIQEQKNLKEKENLLEMLKKRDDDKWDINMSEFDFARYDFSEW
jgi:hypothetical protein